MSLAEAHPPVINPTAEEAYWREAFRSRLSWDEARLAAHAAWERVEQ